MLPSLTLGFSLPFVYKKPVQGKNSVISKQFPYFVIYLKYRAENFILITKYTWLERTVFENSFIDHSCRMETKVFTLLSLYHPCLLLQLFYSIFGFTIKQKPSHFLLHFQCYFSFCLILWTAD